MTLPRTLLIISAILLVGGCRSLNRELNQALPGFLRADPGKEEMEIFAKVRQSREWSEEDLARQKEIFDAAKAALDEGRAEEAGDLFEDYLEQYPSSVYDEAARYSLGESHYLDDDYDAAHEAFRDFAAVYPVSGLGSKVVELQYKMGIEFIEGRRSTFFGIFSQRTSGERILNHVVETFPRSRRAADSQWALGRFAMDEEEDWPKAESAFRFLAEQYKTSEWYEPALFDAAYSTYRQVKGDVYDPLTMKRAEEAFQRYLREAPKGANRTEAEAVLLEVEGLRARQLLNVAEWYLKEGKEYSARFYLAKVRDVYPRSEAAETARQLMAEIGPLGTAPRPDEVVPPPENPEAPAAPTPPATPDPANPSTPASGSGGS